MHPGIIFFLVILGSVLFHIFTPWYWTDVASNWGGMDDTITLTFWIGGGVFIAVCLFMVYCVFKFSYKKDRKAEYKPEDKKLEKILTLATTLGVAALLAPGLIIWNQFITVPKNAIEIDVMAWQWGWQYRLPGEDGKLGTTQIINVNDNNPFGINLDDPYIMNYLAYSWLERNYKIDKAIQMLEKAYQQKINDPYIIDSIGWGYYLVGNFSEAEKILKRAVELMPNDPIVNDHYGDILWKLHRKIQATYFWKNVLNFEDAENEMKEKIYFKLLQGV